jgi:hypothetical protein
MHLLGALVLFKLYWESGIAKWQSHLRDWHDGSAMTFYYETAPLPTAAAWLMHRAPVWWHHVESWFTLAFELVVPLAIFAPWRRARLAVLAILTVFQIVNALTANYGFFCWLACALHVFLLDEQDAERLMRRFRAPPLRQPWNPTADRGIAIAVLALFVTVSTLEGFVHFTRSQRYVEAIEPLRKLYVPWRTINTYHLFGHITRERIEPEFQTTSDGAAWTAQHLHHKAGDPLRRPGFVAPHQPRLDFQLWFYGLDYARGTPAYVVNLLDRLCNDPAAVQGFFAAPLPPGPQAVRIVYWQYHFTRAGEPGWWTRAPRDETRPIPCKQ